jgi:hypothetical protein
MSRLLPAVVAVLALILPGGASAAGIETTVETVPGDFVLSSGTCPNLPTGTTITGSGAGKSITTTRTRRDGLTTVSNFTQIRGSATDQAGNDYRFVYLNSFSVTNTAAAPDVYSGVMHDLFALGGHGPARLLNGFVAVYTTDFGELMQFDPIRQFGDPLDFATGTARCDPL